MGAAKGGIARVRENSPLRRAAELKVPVLPVTARRPAVHVRQSQRRGGAARGRQSANTWNFR